MKLTKLIAAVIAAATAIVPFSSEGLAVLNISDVYAAGNITATSLPDWIPKDYESTLEFRNKYGETHIQDGLICVVFQEEEEEIPEGEPRGVLRYDITTTDGMLKKISRIPYGVPERRDYYEVVVYQPLKQGDVEIKLVDYLARFLVPNYVSDIVSEHSFNVDNNLDIVETDIYGWLPDCVEEYRDYLENNGEVSVHDNYLVFCLESGAGTPYDWYLSSSTNNNSVIDYYMTSQCSVETAEILDGGTILNAMVYKAKKDGTANIDYELAPNYGIPYKEDEILKKLSADCTVTDDAQTIVLNNNENELASYLLRITLIDANTGELIPSESLKDYPFEFVQASLSNAIYKKVTIDQNPFRDYKKTEIYNPKDFYGYSGEGITDYEIINNSNGSIDIKFKVKRILSADSTRVKIVDADTGELIPSDYLKENPFQFRQESLTTAMYPINEVISNPCILDEKQSYVYNKDDFGGYWTNIAMAQPEIITNDNGSIDLVFKMKRLDQGSLPAGATRVTLLDANSGELVPDSYLSAHPWGFGTDIRYKSSASPNGWIYSGPIYRITSNPSIFNDDLAKHYRSADSFSFSPDSPGYIQDVKEYDNGSMDVIFKLNIPQPVIEGTCIDQFVAWDRRLKLDNFRNIKPAVVTSKKELTNVLSMYMSEEILQNYLEKYDDSFFSKYVLLLNFMFDSTGGDSITINNYVISDNNIDVNYTKPSTDFGVCNTDYFCTLQVTVPKGKYGDKKVEWVCTGDANGDSDFGISDLVTLQKWLTASKEAKISNLKTVDLNNDNKVNVFDLCIMRQNLIKTFGVYLSKIDSTDIKRIESPLLVIEEYSANKRSQDLIVFDNYGIPYRRYNANGNAAYCDTEVSHNEKNVPLISFTPGSNWYSELQDIISKSYARVYDIPQFDTPTMALTMDIVDNTEEYANTKWLKSSTHAWDGIDLNIYIISKDSNGDPIIAKLCTLLGTDACLDNKDVQNYVRELAKGGYLDIPDLDIELDRYLQNTK